jgi:hypothetical protein
MEIADEQTGGVNSVLIGIIPGMVGLLLVIGIDVFLLL